MPKKIVTLEDARLNRRERRLLRRAYQAVLDDVDPEQEEATAEPLPLLTPGLRIEDGFWSMPLRRPFHRATGYQLAAANPFAAADMHDAAGPVIGVEKLSGGRAFTFDPWELYRLQCVSSPNLLIQGSLRQGKSFFIKRLLSLLVSLGRYAINTSDSKGEHGALALELGGTVFKMGVFGSEIRLNPLEAAERRENESAEEHASRVHAARIAVLQQIAGLLNPGERPVTSRESTLLDWALEQAVASTGGQPTVREVWTWLGSRELLTAQNGYFRAEDAADLQDGLRRLVHGDLAGMFDTDSSVSLDPDCPYTVIDTFAINQRGSGALAVTQAVTNAWVQATISNKRAGRQYFLIREEGWRDMRTIAALEAQQEQLKLSGEYGVAMVLIVHEDGDFDSVGPEGSKERELAKALLRGYANRICFYQPPATLERAIDSGIYTRAEAMAIATLSRGEFLVKIRSGSYVVDGNPTTTDWERVLFDTDQQMRARLAEAAAA